MGDRRDQTPAGTEPFQRQAADLDLFAGRPTMSAGRLAAILAIAAALAALVNAEALAVWAIDLPLWLGPVREAVVTATRWWADAMAALDLDAPYDGMRALFRRFQDWQPGA